MTKIGLRGSKMAGVEAATKLDLFCRAGLGNRLEEWPLVASPKPSRIDKAIFGEWVSLYTSFSFQFAVDAIRMLTGDRRSLVIDPFVGTGSTLAAANSSGHDAVGIDLDPFSALISRARVALKPEREKVLRSIQSPSNGRKKQGRQFQNAEQLFSSRDLLFTESVVEKIEDRLGCDLKLAFRAILDDQDRRFDSEAVVLASLVVAANQSAKVTRGSNPVWLRRADSEEELENIKPLSVSTSAAASHLLGLAETNKRNGLSGGIRVFCDDARSIELEDGSADVVLTSPPYLNRLDYVVSHYPALALLADDLEILPDALRRSMIGTTKINGKADKRNELGAECQRILRLIEQHPSIASKSYYYWTFLQYFVSMKGIISEIRRVLRRGGSGAIVVQNSFYKDVRIDTPAIIMEMAKLEGLQALIVREQTVRAHMGRMSPKQKKHIAKKELKEYVLYIEN